MTVYANQNGSQSQGVVSEGGALTALGLTASKALVVGAGRLMAISVLVAGSAAGTINDCATVGAVAAGNQIGVIPTTVGVYRFSWPYLTGLVVAPGSGQTVSVSYY